MSSFVKATARMHLITLKKSKNLVTDVEALTAAGESLSSTPTLMQRAYETLSELKGIMAFKAALNKLYHQIL
jgi:hypothetical protein